MKTSKYILKFLSIGKSDYSQMTLWKKTFASYGALQGTSVAFENLAFAQAPETTQFHEETVSVLRDKPSSRLKLPKSNSSIHLAQFSHSPSTPNAVG